MQCSLNTAKNRVRWGLMRMAELMQTAGADRRADGVRTAIRTGALSSMNCDQVFDILTRGPFPTGTACDTPVEAHLNVCRDCRRLAEALRPALELFQEAVGPEESRDLPGYWCAVATDRNAAGRLVCAGAQAAAHGRRHVGAASRWPRHWSGVTVWRMAAMLALGVTVGSLVGSRVMLDGRGTIAAGRLVALRPSAGDDDRDDLTRPSADRMGRAAGCLLAQPPRHRARATACGAIDCWPMPTWAI